MGINEGRYKNEKGMGNRMKKKRNRKKYTRYLAGILAGIVLGTSIFEGSFINARAEEATESQVSFLAVGDDLIHTQVYKAAKKKGRYDFSSIFANIKADVQAADIAAINQETIFVDKKYSGYPTFGSPKALGYAIANAGFDVVTHATNHTMDRGTKAITGTLKFWNTKFPKIKVLGIHKNKTEVSKITVIQKNGIKIAMLNYTYGLNGIKLPSKKSYMVDRLNSTKKMRSDIQKAKRQSDFVIVFAHFGTEYKYSPSSYQKKMASFFAKEGVDLLIGTHPHVVELVRYVAGRNGHKMLTYYSLGNFVSCQKKPDRLLGGMAKVIIAKNEKGAYIKSYDMEPLVTHISSNKKYFTVYKLRNYTEALAKKNAIHKMAPKKKFTVKSLKSLYKKITGRSV